eukprot:scaffold1206_cov56-Attheya_sp.AAC.4
MTSSFQMVKRALFLQLPNETRDFWWPFLRNFVREVWEIAGRRLAVGVLACIVIGILYQGLVDLLLTRYYYQYYYERTHPEPAAHHHATTARTLLHQHQHQNHNPSSSSSVVVRIMHDKKEKKALYYMERAAQLHPQMYVSELAEWHLRAGRPSACLQTLQKYTDKNNDGTSSHNPKKERIMEERWQLLALEARAAMAASSQHSNNTNANANANANTMRTSDPPTSNTHDRNQDPTCKMNQIGALGPNGFFMNG